MALRVSRDSADHFCGAGGFSLAAKRATGKAPKYAINHDNRVENLEVLPGVVHLAHHKTKHPKTKTCVICGLAFTPHPTKRARAQVCSWRCRSALIAVKRHGVPLDEARRKFSETHA